MHAKMGRHNLILAFLITGALIAQVFPVTAEWTGDRFSNGVSGSFSAAFDIARVSLTPVFVITSEMNHPSVTLAEAVTVPLLFIGLSWIGSYRHGYKIRGLPALAISRKQTGGGSLRVTTN